MSSSLHEDLSIFFCCWRHKFAVKAFLCNTQYIYVADYDRNAHKIYCCISTATEVMWTSLEVTLHILCLFDFIAWQLSWNVMLCSLVYMNQCFRESCSFYHQNREFNWRICSDDGGSRILWKACTFLLTYTESHCWRQQFSLSLPW